MKDAKEGVANVERIINEAIDRHVPSNKPPVIPYSPSLKEALAFQRATRRHSIRRVVESMKKQGKL